jgi:large repetitive protein
LITTGQFASAAATVALASQSLTYDGRGNVIEARNGAGELVHKSTFDALNRLTAVKSFKLSTAVDTANTTFFDQTTFGYDTNSNHTKTVDGRGNTWWTTYNAWGLEEDRIEPAIGAEPVSDRRFRTVYDVAGAPAVKITPGDTSGSTMSVTQTFDALGRVTTQTPSTGTAKTFGYDKSSRMTTISHPASPINLQYDDRGLLVGATGGAGTSSFRYDDAGRPVRRADITGVATVSYDPVGRTDVVTDGQAGVTRNYDYNDVGQISTLQYQYSNGTAMRTYGYDPIGRQATDEQTNTLGAVVYKNTYAYDTQKIGNLVSETVTPTGLAGSGTTTYAYRPNGQLSSWTAPGQAAVAYFYDGAGNRTGAGVDSFAYDARNRLTSGGGSTYSWTPRGTMASKVTGATTTSFAFDVFGRMTAQGATTFTWDGLDRIASRSALAFTYTGTSMDPSSDGVTNTSRLGGPLSVKTGVAAARALCDVD